MFGPGSETVDLLGWSREDAGREEEGRWRHRGTPAVHPRHAVRPPGLRPAPSLPSWLPEELSQLGTKRTNPLNEAESKYRHFLSRIDTYPIEERDFWPQGERCCPVLPKSAQTPVCTAQLIPGVPRSPESPQKEGQPGWGIQRPSLLHAKAILRTSIPYLGFPGSSEVKAQCR